MNAPALSNKQITSPARTIRPIMADSTAGVPSRIELLKAGSWKNSAKGDLTITSQDLQEFKNNFDSGVGIPSGLGKIPIDFSHEDWAQAAGWISGLDVAPDANGIPTLYASVDWTNSGQSSLEGGEYKCVSPSFYPACLGEWQDPEDPDVTARNVLVGAGLTNIPFFKGLTPIMASTASSSDARSDKNVMYVQAKETTIVPTLDEVRIKEAANLTAEERQILADHKGELSKDELVKFGFEAAEKVAEATQTVETDSAAVIASLKTGEKMLVEASAFKGLQEQVTKLTASVAEYAEKEVSDFVKTHIERGAIKADQHETWTKKILADAGLKDMLAALPDNKSAAGELGKTINDDQEAKRATDELFEEANKLVTASNGQTPLDVAVRSVLASNKELSERVTAERNTQ